MRSPLDRLQEYIDSHMGVDCGSLRCAQEKILYGLLGVALVVLFLPYVVGVALAVKMEIWSIVLVDTLAYGWLLVLVYSKALTYRGRVYGLLSLIMFLAVSLLLITGNLGAGWLWLFMSPVLAALLLDGRSGYVVVLLNGLLLGGFLLFGLLLPAESVVVMKYGWGLFLAIASNYLALAIIVVFITDRLLQSLEGSLMALQSRTRELELTQEATVDIMATLAEYRDTDTGNHIIRTRHYVQLLAKQLQGRFGIDSVCLDDQQINLLFQSAPLHDIGKIGVPDEILLKPGKLTAEEFEEMKKHAEYGRNTLMHAEEKLGSNHFLRLAAEIAGSHHEKWDGSGYPLGLAGSDIPLPGRIMAVADVYDALTSKRVYKDAMSHEAAIAYIREQSGRQFDPDIVTALEAVQDRFRVVAQKYMDN